MQNSKNFKKDHCFKSKGSKAVDHYLSQYTKHLSNIGGNSADMFICESSTQLATMLSKASTIPTLEPKEHVVTSNAKLETDIGYENLRRREGPITPESRKVG
ncbi:uncharacterized protein LOC125544432 [Triticum urartu]|uniref:uncharacterized protein LOC125544432 n=1 Tax=Triticum urartu TaxID=4572 RepID=UPI002043EBA2|nr:uncharacterized protein LOC125544432 [Triticum urartu]